MNIIEINKNEVQKKELAELHYDFGLIKKENIIKQKYYRSDKGKLWELTILK